MAEEMRELRDRLIEKVQKIRDAKVPILVLVEGWAAAGKGSLIKELISELDPRFYNVVSPAVIPESQMRYPFLYPYATAIPENGKVIFLDSGWMESCVRKITRHEITRDEYRRRVRQVNEFERQLRDAGYIVLKLFLNIDRKEQKARLAELMENPDTEWRVTQEDLWQQREYKRFQAGYEQFMEETREAAPWHVLDGDKRKTAVAAALKLLNEAMEKTLEEESTTGTPSRRNSR